MQAILQTIRGLWAFFNGRKSAIAGALFTVKYAAEQIGPLFGKDLSALDALDPFIALIGGLGVGHKGAKFVGLAASPGAPPPAAPGASGRATMGALLMILGACLAAALALSACATLAAQSADFKTAVCDFWTRDLAPADAAVVQAACATFDPGAASADEARAFHASSCGEDDRNLGWSGLILRDRARALARVDCDAMGRSLPR